MSQVADDLSVAWYQACDLIRSQLPTLAANHSVWILPSLESALFEVSQVLVDRNTEMGGAKTKALFVKGQDPAFEVLGSALSAAGLDTRFCSAEEFRSPASSFDPVKSEVLFVGFAQNSRFTGEVFDFAATRAHILASGAKAAVVRVNYEQVFAETVKPEPWEIVVTVLWSGAALVTLGERFRVSPKSAPYQMPRSLIHGVMQELVAPGGPGSQQLIEDFEWKLPKPFRAVHQLGVTRVWDRVIFTSEQLDGSWVCEKLADAMKAAGCAWTEIDSATTSGCWDAEATFKRADERRQEWLRNNLRGLLNERDIRGMVQIPIQTVKRVTSEKILQALESVATSHK